MALDSLDFPETCGSALMGDGWGAYYNEPPVRLASTTEAGNVNDSTAVGGTMQGTVEGQLTLAAETEAAGEVTTIPNPKICINHERCGRTHSYSSTMDITAYCCDEFAHTNGQVHAEHCSASHVTGWHAPGSVVAELVLNDLSGEIFFIL